MGSTSPEMAGVIMAEGANGQATALNISSPALYGSLQELSFTSFISSIILGLSILILQLLIFSALRKRMRFIYEPRSFLGPENRRVREGPNGFLAWIKPLALLPLEEIAQFSGLDAYFLLRYLLFHLGFWATMCCGVMPILIPINITSETGENRSFLGKLSWENTALYAPDRLIVHCLTGISLIVLLCYYIYRELQAFVAIRHHHVTQSSRKDSSMVLIRQVPRNYLYEPKLTQVFDNYPGGLKRVWINRDYRVLVHLIAQRDKYLHLLETAELKLITKVYTVARKKQKLTEKFDTRALGMQASTPDDTAHFHSIEEDYAIGMKWMKFLKPDDLPQYVLSRSKILFRPKKVDSLTFFKFELDRINSEIEKYQSDSTILCPLVASCLVEFNSPAGSQIACSQGSKIFSSTQFTLTPPSVVHVENSKEIIWENLNVSVSWIFVRNLFSTSLKVITIFGWSFPVAFIGIVSQIRFLIQLVPALAAVNELSPAICETLSSVIPPIILQLLFSFAPKIFYFLALLKKYPLTVMVTLDIQQNLFVFSFIQIFLVLTLSTGITRAIYQAFKFPTSVPALLAANLPKSATFFSSYTVLQGISIAGNELLRIDGLFSYFVLQRLFFCTGRDLYKSNMNSMDSIDFAPLFATIANLGTITIAYSIISPVILVTSVLAFFLMFYSYKYRIVYCNSITHFVKVIIRSS